MIIVESRRLYLREFVSEDTFQLDEVFGDPDVMKYSTNGPLDHEGIKSFISWCLESYHSHGYGQWALIERSSGKVIGSCGLSNVEIEGTQEVEIAYRLAKEQWGDGLVSEIATNVLSYGFQRLNLNKIIAIIATDHEASIRVAEKLGFVQFRESIFKGWKVRIYQQS